jgi:hypothetical protein
MLEDMWCFHPHSSSQVLTLAEVCAGLQGQQPGKVPLGLQRLVTAAAPAIASLDFSALMELQRQGLATLLQCAVALRQPMPSSWQQHAADAVAAQAQALANRCMRKPPSASDPAARAAHRYLQCDRLFDPYACALCVCVFITTGSMLRLCFDVGPPRRCL